MEEIVMKTELSHTQKNSTANYIFFGITLSVFLLSLFFSIVQNKTDLYSNASVSALLSHKMVQPVVSPLTEVQPIDLKKLLVEVTEEPIVIQNWMTQSEWTSVGNINLSSFINTEVVEEAIPLESWMMSTSSWSLINSSDIVEESIPLESWMLSTDNWEVLQANYFSEASVQEEAIPLESWMLNISSWNLATSEDYTEANIPIESWMLSSESWISTEALNSIAVEEEDIPLESWMLSVATWEVIKTTDLASK